MEKFYNIISKNNSECDIANTIRIVGYKLTSHKIEIVMAPLCENRNLVLNRLDSIKEFKICLKHILLAVNSMHKCDFYHNDIRWPNIVYDTITKNYLLIDFERVTNEISTLSRENRRINKAKMKDINGIKNLMNRNIEQINNLLLEDERFFRQIIDDLNKIQTEKEYNTFIDNYLNGNYLK